MRFGFDEVRVRAWTFFKFSKYGISDIYGIYNISDMYGIYNMHGIYSISDTSNIIYTAYTITGGLLVHQNQAGIWNSTSLKFEFKFQIPAGI